jgi:hypothetical protein
VPPGSVAGIAHRLAFVLKLDESLVDREDLRSVDAVDPDVDAPPAR